MRRAPGIESRSHRRAGWLIRRELTRMGVAVALIGSLLALAVPVPQAAAAGPAIGAGTIYFADGDQFGTTAPDSYGSGGESGNPGAPWNITATAVGDSALFLLTDANGNVYEADSNNPGAGLTPVTVPSTCTSAYSPGMSLDPSGSQVVYQNGNELDIANLNGSGEQLLRTLGSDACIDPLWSPNGQWVAYADSTGVNLIPVHGSLAGTNRLVDASGSNPTWSPDGNTLYDINPNGPTVTCADAFGSTYSVTVTDVDRISISGFGEPNAPQPLGIGYFTCEGPANDYGNEFRSFTPELVAASPDGHSLAVYGEYRECDKVDPQAGQVNCGESASSLGYEEELGIVPASGGPATQSRMVLGWGPTCVGGASGFCLDQPPPTASTLPNGFLRTELGLFWAGADIYKIIFYTSETAYGKSGHAFVQFRTTERSRPPVTEGFFPGFSCQGFIPVTGPESILALLFGVPGCFSTQDGNGQWDHRLIYVVTKAQYNAALAFVDDTVATARTKTVIYSLAKYNCMAFANDVANAAGLTLPDSSAGGISGLGLSTPDPITFD
ncbi:MAG TPA: hypothetical protein VFA78_03755, partial [Chloroflexota bacterium]|nr:hypothetical protein [Chloroflexota bacterium]